MGNLHSSSAERDRELRLIEAAIADAQSDRSSRGVPFVRPAAKHDHFPGYTLLREIRRGAQGVVYEGVQRHTQRKVAIKAVVGASLGARRARFEREVQILAKLRHPNIVTIHDSAIIEDRAFFVMDLIDGWALDEYLKQEPLAVNDLVRLFAQISEAVGVAHLHGVIHRDLKPSNIRIDRQGQPKVLDFGLAKLIEDVDQPPDEAVSVVTQTGQFVGSLPWASPEQAEGGGEELDIRTDVYSIGVMFYQALTGVFPYKVTGSMREVTSAICLVDPKRPSSSAAGVNDEVDMIVLKCLAKDRERRYQSAVELARELHRYLDGEPIEAKRDSSWYVLRKTLRRHRVPVAAAVGLMVLLVAFTAALSLLYRQAQTQRDIAVSALAAEASARKEAETETRKARAVQSFLSDMLLAANPLARERTLTLYDTLRAAADQLDREEIEEPEVEVDIRAALSVSFMGMGAYADAEPHLRRAAELIEADPLAGPVQRLEVKRQLVRLLGYQGRLDEAMDLARETLSARRELLGPNHDATLTSAYDWAMLQHAAGRYRDAESELLEVVALRRQAFGDAHPRTIEAVEGLAHVKKELGQLDDAAALFTEAHDRGVQVYGEDHPMVLSAVNNLATIYQDQRKMDRAEEYFRKALKVQTSALGLEHPHRLTSLNNLGNVLRELGRAAEAETMLREAVDIRRRVLGDEHEATITSLINLSVVVQLDPRRLDRAEALLREAMVLQNEVLPADHPQRLTACSNLSSIRWDRGDYAGAAALMRHALEGRIALLGERHPKTTHAMAGYSMALLKINRPDEAVIWAGRAAELSSELVGPRHIHTLAFVMTHGSALLGAKRYEQAETVLLDAYQRLCDVAGPRHAYTRVTRDYLIELYTSLGQTEEVERWREEAQRWQGDVDKKPAETGKAGSAGTPAP